MARPFFLSNAIPYVNGRPHLGHAFEFTQTDCFARWHRAVGRDVFYLSGSDENSLKNVLAAEKEGLGTQQLVDRNVREFEELRDKLSLSYDYFLRTSVDPLHIEGATKLWRALVAAGDVYSKSYEGLYCVGCEQFYTPDELVEGRCPEHGTEPELVQEQNWFFRLSRYEQPLIEAIESDRMRILPKTRRNEVLSFVRGGLDDLSISRSRSRAHGWGIPVPDDPDQVMYVWMDALTNYVTALDYAHEGPLYQRYWAAPDAEKVHDIGKGVLRFHAVYWPAFLMSAGVRTPDLVFAHGYITLSGKKMAKSSGEVFDPAELVDSYGTDTLRYFLLKEVPPTGDADFDEVRLVSTYNTDLGNGLGNLLNRTLTMVHRYLGGTVPGELPDDLAADVDAALDEARTAMTDFDHRAALLALWAIVRRGNAYIEESEPWVLAKAAKNGDTDAAARLAGVLGSVVRSLALFGSALAPFLPGTAERLLASLHATEQPVAGLSWTSAPPLGEVAAPFILFPRIDEPEAAGTS